MSPHLGVARGCSCAALVGCRWWWWLLHPSSSLCHRGKFGIVYRLQEKATGKIRAGKYFRTRTAKEKEAARAEVELMNLLHHPRLVQCLDAFQEPTQLVMVME